MSRVYKQVGGFAVRVGPCVGSFLNTRCLMVERSSGFFPEHPLIDGGDDDAVPRAF